MSDSTDTCLPTTTWFLYSEVEEEPLGRVYRRSLPEVGMKIEADENQGVRACEIVSADELRPTCAIRRFKVVVRPLS